METRKINLGFARTSEGGFYGVDIQGDDAILLCCNKSIYEDVSGDEKVVKVVEAEDLCEILQIGDYVNGLIVDDINVQGREIICADFHIILTPEQVKTVTTKERFESGTFTLQRAYDRAKELGEMY